MVVSLLALLFVIVTGFLSLARNESQLSRIISGSDLIDAVVDDMDSWAISLIKEQIVDSQGKVLPGGNGQTFSFEDIPGYRHSNYLAALEPVWDPAAFIPSTLASGSWSVLATLRWPALTSLDDAVALPQAIPLFRLLRDYDFSSTPIRRDDVRSNARNPFMDADGDGMPDSQFLLCAPATEAANTMAGQSVRLPRYIPGDPTGSGGAFVPFRIPEARQNAWGGPDSYRSQIWQRYDQHARYEVAMRIISHGGMVTLSSPTLYGAGQAAYRPFNRDFAIDLFDAVRYGGRSMRMQYSNFDEQNRLFDELEANTGTVESALRRRFVLPTPPDEVDSSGVIQRRVPPILAELQGATDRYPGFPRTFLPSFKAQLAPGNDLDNWERINIGAEDGSDEQRSGWAAAVARDPTAYNTSGPGVSGMPAGPYDRRHFITTVNHSDELARKQESGDPVPTSMNPLGLGVTGRGATFEGELKFYLGEVGKAFNINASDPWEYDFDYAGKGKVIIEQLTRIYYDMLASHSGSGDDWGDLGNLNTGDDEVVTRRQQAFMLAVNTVAFGAPRDTGSDVANRGLIDLVSYTDAASGTTYTGYSPQPFFTEIIAYDPTDSIQGEEEGNGGGGEGEEEKKLAIAIEMYNPQDPSYYDDGGVWKDHFALNLSQFAIRIDEEIGFTVHPLVSMVPRFLNGREFIAIVIKDTSDGSDRFDTVVDGTLTVTLDSGLADSFLNVSLLRISNDGGRTAVIDRIRVTRPDDGEWKARARDTSPVKYYNYGNFDVATDPDPGVDIEFARWNMVMGKTAVSFGSEPLSRPSTDSLDRLRRQKMLLPIGVWDPDLTGPGTDLTFGPTIPLITMNAAPFNDLPMFGNTADPRPRSFPTVGFMMFIPRYSHATTGGVGDERYHPISHTLKRQWEKRNYTWTPTQHSFSRPLHPTEYPADFGHMPIFDNTQPVTSDSYLAEVSKDAGGTKVGVPWGLLVFDYFTTLNRTRDVNLDGEPDVDPLRVPGRININTAPWYVLANLPLLGPYDAYAPEDPVNGQLPIRVEGSAAPSPASPSPAFWDPAAGVLAGYGYDPSDLALAAPIPRLLATDVLYSNPGYEVPFQRGAGWRYRLGPWLAQSAAAYRDGVQYLQVIATQAFRVYGDASLRSGPGKFMGSNGPVLSTIQYRPELVPTTGTALYDRIRGGLRASDVDPNPTVMERPVHFGFISIGELANVKGFDSSTHNDLLWQATAGDGTPAPFWDTPLARGDFVKAVSILALLDSQYLTTRSNTFTIYTSVMDREEPDASVRSQVTVDRSNLLPRLTYAFDYYDGATHTYYPLQGTNLNDLVTSALPVVPHLLDLDGDTYNIPETPIRTTNAGALPQVIAKQHVGYFNARRDD